MKYTDHPNSPDYIDNPIPAISENAAELEGLCEELGMLLTDFRAYCGDKLTHENEPLKYFASTCYSLTNKALDKLIEIEVHVFNIQHEL
jgi:hypothetical protein